MKIVLVAEEAAGVQVLRLVARGPHTLTAVLTDAAHDGPGVSGAAAELGIPVLPAALVRDPGFGDELAARATDVLLNVHSLHLIAAPVLAAPRIGAFNLHPGPLPQYAGLNVPSWAVYHGRDTHGVSLHWMAAGIDTGPVAYRACFALGPRDTGLTVSAQCARVGIGLVEQLLATLATDPQAVPVIEQDLAQRHYYGRTAPHGGRMPWDRDAEQLERFVRACDYGPWPSPWGRPRTWQAGTGIEIVRAAVAGGSADGPAGTVGPVDPAGAIVACGQGRLRVSRVRAGGATVAAVEVLHPGAHLHDVATER